MKRLLIVSLLLNLALLGYGAWRLADGAGAPAPGTPAADWLWSARVTLFDTLPPADGQDVYLGASIIQYGAWDELFGDPASPDRGENGGLDRGLNRRLNRGIRGDTAAGVLQRLSASVKGSPARVFIMVGLNDLMRDVPLDELLANHAAILENLRAQSPETRVLLLSLLPVRRPGDDGRALNQRIVEANRGLAQLARSAQTDKPAEEAACTYVDLHAAFVGDDGQLRAELTTDGVHLNGAGYALWRDTVVALGLD